MAIQNPTARLSALAAAAALLAAGHAQAQNNNANNNATLAETVVTATRTEVPLADINADVTILNRDDIDRLGSQSVEDVLAHVPGVEFARNGGVGQTTSVFLRGADNRFTSVYIDGVRVDAQGTGGAQWEQIPLSMIDRVEVVRGPAAAIYGSDAVGGVIQLFTKRGQGKPQPYAGVGVGSHGYRSATAGVGGAQGGFDYSLGLSRERSSGFDVTTPSNYSANPDKDGYERKSANAKLGYQIDARHRLEGTLLASNLNAQYDGSSTADDRAKNQLRTAGAALLSEWTDRYSTRLQYTQTRSVYETEPSPYNVRTDLRGLLLQNNYVLGSHRFNASVERREDRLTSDPDFVARQFQNAVAVGYGFNAAGHHVQLNLRKDQDSEFGGKTTGGASYGYDLTPQLRASVSAATSFRAPTLYQRFGGFSPDLRPEEGRNLEAALRWRQDGTTAGVVVYRNRVRNLIDWVATAWPCTSDCYSNVGRARLQGVTVNVEQRLAAWTFRASVDFQDPKNLETDKLLARRSRKHGNVGADYRAGAWTLGGNVLMVGRRFDDSANTQRLNGYATADLYATYALARDWSIQARLNNLADKDYILANGYNQPGREVYVTLRWQPK